MSKELTGVKHDADKLPWELLPYDALREVVKVLLFGKQKYSARNWENGIVYSRLYAAAIRHLTSWFQDGENTDPETGISHLAHASCCVLFMLAFTVRKNDEVDDRPRPVNKLIGRKVISATELMDNKPELQGLKVRAIHSYSDIDTPLVGTIVKGVDGNLKLKSPEGWLLRESVIEMEVLSE